MPLFQFFFIKILFISIFLLLSYQKATTQPLVFAWDKLNIVIESHNAQGCGIAVMRVEFRSLEFGGLCPDIPTRGFRD